MKRGEVWWVNFDTAVGSEVKKTRPAIIISKDISNQYSQRVQVVPLTSSTHKLYPPECYVIINNKTSKAMADQIMTVSKRRLSGQLGTVSMEEIAEIERVVMLQLGIKT